MTEELTAQQEVATILSQTSEQKIEADNIDHRILFVSTLVIVLVGVMYADNQATEAEKLKIKSIVSQFIPANGRIWELIKILFSRIQKNKTYADGKIIKKLSSQLSRSEKILIVDLCREVSSADGETDQKETRYIELIAKIFSIEERHLTVILESNQKKAIGNEVLDEVHALLDPHHFQNLDPVFMAAADVLRSKLPRKLIPTRSQDKYKINYEKLVEFQQIRGELSEVAYQLLAIIQEGVAQDVLSDTIQDETFRILEKVQSQRFRLAVVGEFSQGKSTFLNALLGEEVQPARAIPCSGTITVLKYGDRERVVCRYKDGQEEEVSVDRYHELASISQEAALSNIADELSKSTVQEIIFEHPKLELCRHQVEIVDSPGLNEHPERTAITEKLLENTDAAIFLANASRPLAQGERELLKSLHVKLQGGSSDQPAKNLFVLVNFMDLLRREKDQVEVRELFKRFLQGDTPIIEDSQRLHFISAQSALDAILEGRRDDFVSSLEDFTDALQNFLTQDCGNLVLQKINKSLQGLMHESRAGFKQTGHLLDGRVSLSEMEKEKIICQIGEASGREVKLRLLHDELMEESVNLVASSLEEWGDGIEERIAEKSADWKSESEDNAQIMRDYSSQFMQDISDDLDDWLENKITKDILQPKLQKLTTEIAQEIKSIRDNLRLLDSISGSNLSTQFDLSISAFGVDMDFISNLNPEAIKERGILGNLGLLGGGGLAGGVLAFIGVGLLPILLGSLVVGWFLGGSDNKYVKMKTQVYEKGFERFIAQSESIGEKIFEKTREAFSLTLDPAIEAIECSIVILDNLLIQQEKIYEESVFSRDAKKEYLRQALVELDSVESKLKHLLAS